MVRLFFRNKKIDSDKAKQDTIQSDIEMKPETMKASANNLEEELEKLK